MNHTLVYYGNATLKKVAEEIKEFDENLEKIASEMFDIMKKAKGIGLAAPQIDIPIQLVVIDISSCSKYDRFAIVNPEIVWSSDDAVPYEEGCLSVPGIWEEVLRPSKIEVHGFDLKGKPVEYKADDILARVFQHELDHLKGVLFIDRIPEYRKKEHLKELKQIRKLNKE